MPTLTVCLITRNEEAHLRRCLESVRGLADDIVVVDTGSTDGTVEIARSSRAHLFHFPWQDDFSLARNHALAHAPGDWILSIDADESIALRDHDRIRQTLSRDDVDAVLVPQRHYMTSATVVGWQPGTGGYEEGAPYPGFVDVACLRLFRNRPWIRFRNRVHEVIASTDPSRTLTVARDRWVIHHFGKVGDPRSLRAKAEAYVELGIRKVTDTPADPQAHYELGIQHLELEQPGPALPCFEAALALSGAGRSARAPDDTPLRIAMCLSRLGRHDEALLALRAAAGNLPRLAAEIALEEGNVHCALGDDVRAEDAFRRATAANPALLAPLFNLGLVRERQGHLPDALAWLDRALDLCPSHPEVRLQRARVRKKAGNDAAALEDLEGLPCRSAARLRARILLQQRRFDDAHASLAAAQGDDDAEGAGLLGAAALGMGRKEEAVRHLRRSLQLGSSVESARNLSTALELQGDRTGALAATAELLRLVPHDVSAQVRLAALAGDTLGRRAAGNAPASLTIFFYAPGPAASIGIHGNSTAAMAAALATRGHRVVVLNGSDEPESCGSVGHARWETLPVRCLDERPDVIVGAAGAGILARVRLAPLQIAWIADVHSAPADGGPWTCIDFVMGSPDRVAGTRGACLAVPPWRVIPAPLVPPAPADGRPAHAADDLAVWEGTCLAALAAEPPVLERVASHLAADRAALAHRMVERERPPQPLRDPWAALVRLTAWRAGVGGPPSADDLRLIAVHFTSLRHADTLAATAAGTAAAFTT